MENIYSDLRGEILGDRIYLYDQGDVYHPALILWNKLQIEKLIDFLKETKEKLK